VKILNFSDLDTVDNEGNFLSIEDRLIEENNVFRETGVSSQISDEERLLYRMALNKLTPRQKQVVLCIDYHGMSQDEAAEILQIEHSVISKHYKAAMKKLKKFCLDK